MESLVLNSMAIVREKSKSKMEPHNSSDTNGGDVPDMFKDFYKKLKKSSVTKQMSVGVGLGITAGYLSSKFGKLAAVAIGGSMLVLQIASYNGYIEIDWKKLNQDVKVVKAKVGENKSKLPMILENVENFVKENVVMAGGFASGFLIGFAWA